MDKKIITAQIKDMTEDARAKLVDLYNYASINEVSEVILFSKGLLGSENSLEDVVNFIPEVGIRTCLFLGSEDIYSLSPSAFNRALSKREDINVNLDGCLLEIIGNKTVSFFNDLSHWEMCEDDLKGSYAEGTINVFVSKYNHGVDYETYLSGRAKIFVGPVKASMFEDVNGSVIYSDLMPTKDGLEVGPEHIVFSKEKEYVKKK